MKINFFDWHPATAAADLETGSVKLSVYSPIISPMISDTVVSDKTGGIDITTVPVNGGDECNGTVEVASCVIAQYIGRSNITPPCIVKGERVLLSPHINGIYYWKEMGLTDHYRKTEKLMIRVANKLTSLTELGPDNAYSIIMDSNEEYILIFLAAKTPDKLTYYFMIDQANGKVTLTDSKNNMFVIDSTVPSLLLTNTNGTTVELNKNKIIFDAPESITLKAGTLVNIKTPAIQISSDAMVVDSTDVAINANSTMVITSPTVGVNGFFQATAGIVSNLISGGVVSMGGSASPIAPCTISTTYESSVASGASTPPAPATPTDVATAFSKFSEIMTNVVTALTTLGVAITATNAAHTGPTTAPAAGAAAAVTANATTIGTITSAIPGAAMPNIQGDSAV